MGLALAAADTLRGKGRLLCQPHGLGVLKASLPRRFDEHGVVAAEGARNIHALGAGHAVSAPGTAHLVALSDFLRDLPQDLAVLRGEGADVGLGRDAAVLTHHVKGIHAGKDHRDLRLIVEPTEAPFSCRPSAPALAHDLFCALRQHSHKLSAAQGLHDDDGNSFFRRGLQPDDPRLGVFVEIVVLDLTEIPIVILQDFEKPVRIAVVGKAYVSDFSAFLFLIQPLDRPDVLQLFPHGDIRQMVHQIVIDIIGAQAGKLFSKVLLKRGPAADKILRELCGDVDLFTNAVARKDLAQRGFAAAVNICGIKIVDASVIRLHDLPFGFFQIDASALLGKPHTSEAENRKAVSGSVFSVLHRIIPHFLPVLPRASYIGSDTATSLPPGSGGTPWRWTPARRAPAPAGPRLFPSA